MSGRGDDLAELAFARALERGPLDFLGLLSGLRTSLADMLSGREGGLHAVLQRLVRRGDVEVVGHGPAGLALYGAGGTPPVPPPPDDPPFEPVEEPRHARDSLRAVASVRDPAARGRIQADILAHLESLGQDTSAFGSVRGLRTLLHRIDRGRPTVCLIQTAGDGVRRFVLHEGPWIGGAALIWILLKVFVLQTYVIPSESMVPTLLKWDRVVVFRFAEGEAPERFSVTTFEGKDKTLVKRLVGLSGESIALLHGDVFINGEVLVKPDDVRAALRWPLGRWDLRAGPTPAGWTAATRDGGQDRVWHSGRFEAYPPRLGVERGGAFAMRDGYVEVDVDWSGTGPVDLTLTRGPNERRDEGVLEGSTTWRLRLSPAGFSLVETYQPPGAEAAVVRTLARETGPQKAGPPNAGPQETGPLAAGRYTLGWSYVDGVLRAQLGSLRFEGARPAVDGPLSFVLRMAASEAGALQVSVDRDIHYAHLGERATPVAGSHGRLQSHDIPAGYLFFLGDNTTNSTDSRFGAEMGDVPASSVVGPVSFRIWPPSRWGRVR